MILRLCLSKEGPARFISHLDYSRAIERALRRAQIPVQFTEGFNPRMKLSFADALPVGMVSRAEWLDVHLKASVDPAEAKRRLGASLPAGVRVLELFVIPDNLPPLTSLLEAVTYEATVRLRDCPDHGKLIQHFLRQEEIRVERPSRGVIDVKGSLLDLRGEVRDGKLIVYMTTSGEKTVRPEPVIRALDDFGGSWLDLDSLRVEKTGMVFRGSSLTGG
ncbi:MAG TPA: DUF2344 domain-containing protein [Firmicutes bacterium]|nr:DUF2344 domain-containing protein [Bacillota bacterium]